MEITTLLPPTIKTDLGKGPQQMLKPLSEKLSHGTKSVPIDYFQITKHKIYLYTRAFNSHYLKQVAKLEFLAAGQPDFECLMR